MPNKTSDLQSYFLNQLRKNRIPTQIFLTSGVRFSGTIHSFDPFVLVVDVGRGKQQLIYKHMISTIIPAKSVDLTVGR